MNLNTIDIRGTNNYKGLATLGTDVTEGLTATLKALGDGVGGYSPLKLSTSGVDIGTFVSMGGVTTSFPAIKRTSAAIDLRLANDSDYCGLTSRSVLIRSEADQYTIVNLTASGGQSFITMGNGNGNTGEIKFSGTEVFVINRTWDATAYKVNGTAGASFSGSPSSITVVNGLITAIS